MPPRCPQSPARICRAGDTSAHTGTDLLLAGLIPSIPQIEWKELSAPSPAAPPAPPAPVSPPRYIHPELAAVQNLHGGGVTVVKWAINRMTDDYTVRDLLALLKREGQGMDRAHVSLILANLKNRGEIEQLKPSSGATPALYRKPANPPNEESDAVTSGAEQTDHS